MNLQMSGMKRIFGGVKDDMENEDPTEGDSFCLDHSP